MAAVQGSVLMGAVAAAFTTPSRGFWGGPWFVGTVADLGVGGNHDVRSGVHSSTDLVF
jgi:hypothetical protein